MSDKYTSRVLFADVPNREETFVKRAADFQAHSKSMANTAAALAKSGAVTDRKLADDLIFTATKVRVRGREGGRNGGREGEMGEGRREGEI